MARSFAFSGLYASPPLGIETPNLDNISLDEFIEPSISEPILVSIAAAASRFGLDRGQLSVGSEILDEYSGHSGDPFKTLTRSYP